jgi:hypothetical protein
MKTFYIEQTSRRVDRINARLPWLLLALFVAGLIAADVWPSSKPILRVAFYVLLVAYAAYLVGSLVKSTVNPVNYRFLRLSDGGIEYKDFGPDAKIAKWDEIKEVIFIREEALFEDMGPYLESKWRIQKNDGKTFEVMNEIGNRGPLLRAFRESLLGFDVQQAHRAMQSWKTKGKWTCFERSTEASESRV